MNIILWDLQHPFPSFGECAENGLFQPFQGTPDNLHFKYYLLVTFSTVSENNQGGLQVGSPRQRGLNASGLERRQSGGETHKHQTNQ
ncbi:hypothetical protein CI672_003410 [Escherichia coli]|nr:hypothetical protein [Escherichia coli]EFH6968594.1 hypothetical protein [Escherichia coli]EFH7024337.1 hypothetical protein [Escherichia coli]EFI4119133.1 hypothetical protein [Escherichia coli]TNK22526.1 hypothetical protein CI672_003410 [Escherichia coli]